jgi:thiol-disulfide isomerase/thioredoxin
MRRLLAILAALLLSVAAVACGGSDGAAPLELTPEADRERAKPFSVAKLVGRDALTLDQFRGKPVVLNFWASWCIPCEKETPDLQAFSAAHPDVAVVGISLDEVPADARAFAKKHRVTYALGSDPQAQLEGTYGFPGLPSTYFIDASGRLAATPAFGPLTRDTLESFAAALPS